MKRYGPHREADAPSTVLVLGYGKYPREQLVPIPAALIAQRRHINARAHQAGSR